MAWNEIPLDPTPDQEFRVTVTVGDENKPLVIRLRYNTEGKFWRMDVSDGNTLEMLISGIPLVTGEYPAADLLRQFQHFGLGTAVILPMTERTLSDRPGFSDLGTDFVLVWGSEDVG